MNNSVSNYIVFSYIKDFVDDLCTVYDDESLKVYALFLKDANITCEIEDFVINFRPALDGTTCATYCEGAFIDVPKFISQNDENLEIIQAHLKTIKKMYECPELCPEYEFLTKYSTELLAKTPEPNIQDEESAKSSVKNMFVAIKPDAEKAKKEFFKKKLSFNRFFKIILVLVNDKFEALEDDKFQDVSERQAIKNIIEIVANNPLSELASKKLEIIKEFMQIKSIQNIPFNTILTNL